MLGSRRRSEKEISALHWFFRHYCLSPSSSRTFRTQSCWSFLAGQCCNSERILPTYFTTFDVRSIFTLYQQWIDTWRSRFEQKTDSILLAHWSKRQRSSRSGPYWLHYTTSSTILAQCMEETSRRGILGWYWSFDSKGIDILSDSIECKYPSRNTSSFLYSNSCEIEDWRSLVWKIIRISLTTTKDLLTTRSRLDQREWSIEFYSWTTASR